MHYVFMVLLGIILVVPLMFAYGQICVRFSQSRTTYWRRVRITQLTRGGKYYSLILIFLNIPAYGLIGFFDLIAWPISAVIASFNSRPKQTLL